MRQKQISKGINNNRKSITLTQCLKVFNQKTSTGPVYVYTVCLQTWFRTSVQDVANLTFKSQLEKKKHILNVHRGMYRLIQNNGYAIHVD